MEPRYHNSPNYNDKNRHKRDCYNKGSMSGRRFPTFNGSGSSSDAPQSQRGWWDAFRRCSGLGLALFADQPLPEFVRPAVQPVHHSLHSGNPPHLAGGLESIR